MWDEMVAGVWRDSDMRIVLEARQDRLFIAHRHVQCVGEQDRVRFARIHTALENDVADQFIVSDTQTLENRSPDFAFGMSQREFDFGKPEHNATVPNRCPTQPAPSPLRAARRAPCSASQS